MRIYSCGVLLFFRWSIWNRRDIRFMRCGDQRLRMDSCVLCYKRSYVSFLCFMGILGIRYAGSASGNHRERESVHKRTNRYYCFKAKGTYTEMIICRYHYKFLEQFMQNAYMRTYIFNPIFFSITN